MTLYVGIDVAKRRHTAVVLDEQGQVVMKAFSIQNDRAGMDDLLARLAAVNEPVEVGLEATGHYWLALFDQLRRASYPVYVFNPLQVHAYQRSGIRKRKTDKSDAIWVADYLRVSGPLADPLNPDVHLQLRRLARFRSSLVDQIGDAKRRILTVLDQVFPEYERLFSNVFIASSRRLLSEAVTAQDFADFDLDELTDLLHQSSRGHFGRDKAETIQRVARQSIGVGFLADAARLELGCLLAQLNFLEDQVTQVEQALETLINQLPKQYLTTIPGIGSVAAATILGEIGDIRRFASPEKLVAYAGIDPTVYESGEFQGSQAHMSKRGSPHLRRALWLAATSARLHDPELRAYYDKRRAEGKAYGTVMGALCRKLLARIYVVLREQRPYVVHD
jgi:transposase